jgi:hypothetical protein
MHYVFILRANPNGTPVRKCRNAHRNVLKSHGVSMSDMMPEQAVSLANPPGMGPYLKALTLATGLLAVWAGLCAI